MREEQTQSHAPRATLQTPQGPGLAEVLHALDDETLQRIFKMAQPLMGNDLQHDGDAAAVEQSSSMKGGDLRRYKREDAADTPLQMKEGQRSSERFDVSVTDLSNI